VTSRCNVDAISQARGVAVGGVALAGFRRWPCWLQSMMPRLQFDRGGTNLTNIREVVRYIVCCSEELMKLFRKDEELMSSAPDFRSTVTSLWVPADHPGRRRFGVLRSALSGDRKS